MLDYHLGDMKDVNSSALRYEVEAKSSECANGILQKIETTDIYKELHRRLPSKYLSLYFKLIIKKDIHPYITQGSAIQWHKRNGSVSIGRNFVLIPRFGFFDEFVKHWDFEDITLKLVSPLSLRALMDSTCRTFLVKKFWARIKKRIVRLTETPHRFKRKNSFREIPKKETIACHYAEGIEPSRRNDLNWYFGSDIKPEEILIYFDDIYAKTGRPIEEKVIKQIDSLGFRWAALKRNIIENDNSNYWINPSLPKHLFLRKNMAQDICEKWIVWAGNDLLEQVYYWRLFYDEFNIRINYVPEEGFTKNIAQAIAFDIYKEKQGVLIGKQRSEIFIRDFNIAHHPKHVFFTWNRRIGRYLNPDYEYIRSLITSGYPNNFFKRAETYSLKLKERGVEFIIALFDNMHGRDNHFSTKGMTEFYRLFLQWLLEDKDLGLIIKSKKAYVIRSLPEIHPLLEKALETKRCIRLDDEWGRFPSDASFGADMACGVGISSAVIEAVIAGCRGVHYDMTGLRNHEFYKWGYERIIFDDLDRMLTALKRYKENRESEPDLGNWSSHMDDLDPFRDGKGGERMGLYMRWLLNGFEKGMSRDEAIKSANELYSGMWGSDKIIDMRHSYETA